MEDIIHFKTNQRKSTRLHSRNTRRRISSSISVRLHRTPRRPSSYRTERVTKPKTNRRIPKTPSTPKTKFSLPFIQPDCRKFDHERQNIPENKNSLQHQEFRNDQYGRKIRNNDPRKTGTGDSRLKK